MIIIAEPDDPQVNEEVKGIPVVHHYDIVSVEFAGPVILTEMGGMPLSRPIKLAAGPYRIVCRKGQSVREDDGTSAGVPTIKFDE